MLIHPRAHVYYEGTAFPESGLFLEFLLLKLAVKVAERETHIDFFNEIFHQKVLIGEEFFISETFTHSLESWESVKK